MSSADFVDAKHEITALRGGNRMYYRMLAAKIHRARVTEADLNYVGSVTIDRDLLDASGLMPYEMVQISNLATGALWHTYIIEGPRGRGDICLNGPPARLFHPDDRVIIIGYRQVSAEELDRYYPKLVFVDDNNRVTDVLTIEPPFTLYPDPAGGP
ncbi:aspartate 1-decarboxylase [Sulfobacillus acidophilus TPY]|nr:aspartate 1-decarboxylase [Sulfobacillus acidophilus TPY]